MNYRHDFHAGNFADVFKHAVLTRILVYLRRKPAPFRVIDTHAGSGRYDLGGEQAARTREWRDGIGRIDADAMTPEISDLVAPFLALVDTAGGSYPGSPAIALALTRPFDRMIFCELHPEAFADLRACIGRDKRAKAVALDGYVGLNAFVPPLERRGLVLIDPPFEAEDEFDRLTMAILAAHRKWREGIILAWHPIKARRGPARLAASLVEAGVKDVLRLELAVLPPTPEGRLTANGLMIVNAPYTLEDEMRRLLPILAGQMAGPDGTATVERLA